MVYFIKFFVILREYDIISDHLYKDKFYQVKTICFDTNS